MPASEIMRLYRQHKLHSGPGGPVVKKKKQAVAIQISMARKEGHHIPEVKGSFQHGGLVPETGDYRVHEGEQVRQARDIAARTRGVEENEWRQAMHTRGSPLDLLSGPPPASSAHYAVEGLKGNVAERMRQQGEAAVRGSFREGGSVKQTGDYFAHAGEELVPADINIGGMNAIPSPADPEDLVAPERAPDVASKPSRRMRVGSDDNPQLKAMAEAVNSPLQRVQGFRQGGTIPRTGIYRLHQGERVIPKSLAAQYRKARHA